MKLFGRRNEDASENENLIEEIYGDLREREISQIKAAAERLEAYDRMRSRKRRRAFLRGAGITLILLCLTVGVLYLGYRLLFLVDEFVVEGESPYTDEEIIAGTGIGYGTPIFSFRESDAESALIYALPCITDLQVDRQAPGKVTLRVKCESAVYFTEIYGKIYLMSDSLRLLGEAKGDTEGLIKLCLPPVKSAEMGQAPVFWNDDAAELLTETAEAVRASALADRIVKIDLRDMFSLTMVCDRKYLLEFGEYSEVETKLRIAATVLQDDMFKTQNKARINLSVLSETSVIVDNQLVLD